MKRLSALLAAAGATVLGTPAAASETPVKQVKVTEVTQLTPAQERQDAVIYQVAVIRQAGWRLRDIRGAIRKVEVIYAQCDITVTAGAIHWLSAPQGFDELSESEQTLLLQALSPDRPAALFVSRTTDGHTAYSYLNSAPAASRGTAWITRNSGPPCTGALLAHELGHIVLNTDRHSAKPRNLMAYACTYSNITGSAPNIELTESQCRRLRERR